MQAPANLSALESWALKSVSEIDQILSTLSDEQAREIEYDWRLNARPSQLLPGSAGATIDRSDWLFWLLIAGRGYGKTRVGAETVREWGEDPQERILLVGPTAKDIRETMIEGPSGFGLLSARPAPALEGRRRRNPIPFRSHRNHARGNRAGAASRVANSGNSGWMNGAPAGTRRRCGIKSCSGFVCHPRRNAA